MTDPVFIHPIPEPVATGDRFRLADTELICRVERSLLVPGDEVIYGGGKTVRDGMGQVAGLRNDEGVLDLVITNAIVMDPVLGIVKADIGVKDGRIAGIGKSGNPFVMDGVHPNLVVGAGTGGGEVRVLGLPAGEAELGGGVRVQGEEVGHVALGERVDGGRGAGAVGGGLGGVLGHTGTLGAGARVPAHCGPAP